MSEYYVQLSHAPAVLPAAYAEGKLQETKGTVWLPGTYVRVKQKTAKGWFPATLAENMVEGLDDAIDKLTKQASPKLSTSNYHLKKIEKIQAAKDFILATIDQPTIDLSGGDVVELSANPLVYVLPYVKVVGQKLTYVDGYWRHTVGGEGFSPKAVMYQTPDALKQVVSTDPATANAMAVSSLQGQGMEYDGAHQAVVSPGDYVAENTSIIETAHGSVPVSKGDSVYQATNSTVLIRHEDKSWDTYGATEDPHHYSATDPKVKGLLIASHGKTYTKLTWDQIPNIDSQQLYEAVQNKEEEPDHVVDSAVGTNVAPEPAPSAPGESSVGADIMQDLASTVAGLQVDKFQLDPSNTPQENADIINQKLAEQNEPETTGIIGYQCPDCGLQGKTIPGLKKHMKAKHGVTGEEPKPVTGSISIATGKPLSAPFAPKGVPTPKAKPPAPTVNPLYVIPDEPYAAVAKAKSIIEGGRNSARLQLWPKTNASGNTYWKDENGNDLSWSQFVSLTDKQKFDHLADQGSLATELEERVEGLEAIKKNKGVDKITKQKIGKERSRLDAIARAIRLAQGVKNEEVSPDAATTELEFLAKKMSPGNVGKGFGQGYKPNMGQYWEGLSADTKAYAFKVKLKSASIDLDDIGMMRTWAEKNGALYPDLMTDEEIINFSRAKLGDPSLKMMIFNGSYESQTLDVNLYLPQVQGNAIKEHTMAQSLADAKAYLAEQAAAKKEIPEASAGPSPESQDQAVIQAKNLKKQEFTSNLKQQYKNLATSETLTQVEDGFELATVDADGLQIQSSGVLAKSDAIELMSQQNDWVPATTNPAKEFLSPDVNDAINLWLDGSPLASDLNYFIKAHGGNYVGKMSTDDKQEWIHQFLVGSHVHLYALEQAAASKGAKPVPHKLAGTHSGSPTSVKGKKNLQLMSDYFAQTEWGKKIILAKASNAKVDLTADETVAAYFALNLNLGSVYLPGDVDKSDWQSSGLLATANPEVLDFVELMPPLPEPTGGMMESEVKLPEPPVVSKPDTVDAKTWKFLEAVESLPDQTHPLAELAPKIDAMDVDELNQKLAFQAKHEPWIQTLIVEDAPINVKKLALYASKLDLSVKFPPPELSQALEAKVTGGAYEGLKPPGYYGALDIPGGKVGKDVYVLQAGDSLKKDNKSSAVLVFHSDGTSTLLDKGYAQKVTGVSSKGLAPYVPVKLTAIQPKPVGRKFLSALGSDYTDDVWTDIATAEQASPDTNYAPITDGLTGEEVNELLRTYAKKRKITFEQPFYDSAPLALRKLMVPLVYTSLTGKPDPLATGAAMRIDLVNKKAKWGHYGFKNAKPAFDLSRSYAKRIAFGQVDQDSVYSWTDQERLDFIADFGLPYTSGYAYQTSEPIAAKLSEIFQPPSPDQKGSEPEAPIWTKAKDQSSMGGSHSTTRWIDQHGRKWFSKAYPHDPNSAARVEAEHNANLVGRLFGFRQPETHTAKLENKYQYVQFIAPKTGDVLKFPDPSQMDDQLLEDVIDENVLDWLVGNHDSHGNNLLIGKDGRLIGVDKGQAWKFFGTTADKLQLGYTPAGNVGTQYYYSVYNAIISHKISKERADKLVQHALKRARSMSKRADARYEQLVRDAFKSRTSWPSDFPNIDAMTELAMQRKHGLATDFEKYFQGIYEKAGYEWDLPDIDNLDDATVETDSGVAYVGISAELIDSVKKAHAHGVSTLFSGEDLEDGSLLLMTMQETGGSTTLIADGKLRKNADKRVSGWIKKQTVTNKAGTSAGLAQVQANEDLTLPLAETWYGHLSAAAKTVNVHQADGEYNAATLQQMETDLTDMQKYLPQAQAQLADHKSFKIGGMTIDDHKLEAWIDMAEYYMAFGQTVKEAHASKGKTYTDAANKIFNPYVYKPKPQPKLVNEWSTTDTKQVLKQFADGTWTLYDSTIDETKKLTNSEGENLSKSETFVTAEVLKSQAAKAPLILYKRPNNGPQGAFDKKDGLLKQNGEHGIGAGYRYDIESGNIVIEYRPWTGDGVSKAQQGYIRLRVKNFSGSEDDMQQAVDILHEMGVDLSPADEESLELMYWKQMEGIAGDRVGYDSGKRSVMLKNIQDRRKANPDMSPQEELEMLREEWASFIGKDMVDNVDFMPHFGHGRLQEPSLETGKPYWNRPDADAKVMASLRPVSHGFTNTAGRTLMPYTGQLMATEERLRMLGQLYGGMSSSPDQSKGSSPFVFTHPNNHSQGIILNPRVWLRTSNYIYSSDHYGNIDHRKTHAPFELPKMLSMHSGEMMIKNALTILDDIEVIQLPANEVKAVIDFLHSLGIYVIRGVPIEERIVSTGAPAQWEKIKNKTILDPKDVKEITDAIKLVAA